METEIPKYRKALFLIGTVMMACGVILFLSTFFSIILLENFLFFLTAPLGMVLCIIGAILRSIGGRGLAGSGITLNPNKAREELRPHSKAVGGILNDVVSEVQFPKDDKVIVKIKCTQCGSLNEDTSNFCNQCGVKI